MRASQKIHSYFPPGSWPPSDACPCAAGSPRAPPAAGMKVVTPFLCVLETRVVGRRPPSLGTSRGSCTLRSPRGPLGPILRPRPVLVSPQARLRPRPRLTLGSALPRPRQPFRPARTKSSPSTTVFTGLIHRGEAVRPLRQVGWPGRGRGCGAVAGPRPQLNARQRPSQTAIRQDSGSSCAAAALRVRRTPPCRSPPRSTRCRGWRFRSPPRR